MSDVWTGDQSGAAASPPAPPTPLPPAPLAPPEPGPTLAEAVTDIAATAADVAAAPSLPAALAAAEADAKKYHLSRCLRAIVIVALAAVLRDHAHEIPDAEIASVANDVMGVLMYGGLAVAALYRVLATTRLK
jgi:hypothetical protein